MTVDVTVQVVTYNNADTILPCLRSVSRQVGVHVELHVLDNASEDDTVARVGAYGDVDCVVESGENLGFGSGHNRLAEQAAGRLLFLLNPDAVIVPDGGLLALVRHLQANPHCGLVSPAILEAGSIVRPRARYPGERRSGTRFPGLPGRIAWVVGAAMCVSTGLYRRLGGFDPEYFLYGEETDLCLRMRRIGYQIDYLPSVGVRHVGGASERQTPRRVYWMKRAAGRLLFYRKHCRDWPTLVRRELYKARIRLAMLAIMENLHLSHGSEKVAKYLGLKDACLRELELRRR